MPITEDMKFDYNENQFVRVKKYIIYVRDFDEKSKTARDMPLEIVTASDSETAINEFWDAYESDLKKDNIIKRDLLAREKK